MILDLDVDEENSLHSEQLSELIVVDVFASMFICIKIAFPWPFSPNPGSHFLMPVYVRSSFLFC